MIPRIDVSHYHTPGPWSAEQTCLNEISIGPGLPGDPESRQVCTILCEDGDASVEPGENDWADARLIAAAPELLEALRPFAEPHAMGDNYVQFAPGLIRAARAAIAKAEGAATPGRHEKKEPS